MTQFMIFVSKVWFYDCDFIQTTFSVEDDGLAIYLIVCQELIAKKLWGLDLRQSSCMSQL